MTTLKGKRKTSKTTGWQSSASAGSSVIGSLHGETGSEGEISLRDPSDGMVTVMQTRRPTCSKGSVSRPLSKPRVEVTDQPISRQELAKALGQLAKHDRSRTDWSPEQWASLMVDYLDDLEGYPPHLIDLGLQHWRRHGHPWFPTIAEFLTAMEYGTKEWMGYKKT